MRGGLADFVDATMPCVSAHQMGTARMGADPASSVCDPNGESWDVSGLFVCDGAALPTSIGEHCNGLTVPISLPH